MSLIENLLVFFFIVFFYILIVFILHRKGVLNRYGISFYGPALLLRTKKGRGFLKKIAKRKRFWKSFGNFGIVFCFIMMVLIVALLIFNAWTVLGFTPEQIESLPGIEFGLVLPGINPILPLEYVVYIVLALIIAVISHEFSHGILTFASKLKVKSLGVLYLIIPLGAFCEPDEEQLRKTKVSNRMRVFAAGPTANFAVVLITLLLFSFVFMSAVNFAEGVDIMYVGEDTPAEEIGLSTGMVLTNINNTRIINISDFSSALGNTNAGQKINISYVKQEKTYTKNVILADKYNFTKNVSHLGKGYLGVGPNFYRGFLTAIKNPFIQFPDGFILLYALPILGYFWGYNPIASPFTDSYIITGPLGLIPMDIFWAVVSALYWIFWLNLAVAIFNVLPILPLDGGFLFNDAIGSFIKRFKKNLTEEQREKIVKNISLVTSLMILFIFLFPWLLKYF